MANWNYRVIRKHCAKSGMVTLQIHEVYYAEDGSVDCWTQQPVEPLGTSEPNPNPSSNMNGTVTMAQRK